MRHKSVCPLCGKYTYLRYKIIDGGKAFVPSVIWMCDECSKPIEVRMTRGENND